MKHFFSKISEPETTVTATLNACDFAAQPFSNGKSGKHMLEVMGYHVCSLKGEELSGRGIKVAIMERNPLTNEYVRGYSLTPSAYKKLCETHNVAENKDAHWDGMIVR